MTHRLRLRTAELLLALLACGCNSLAHIGDPRADASTGGAVCGNAVLELREICDGANLNGQTCESQGFAGGTLACRVDCSFDPGGCASVPGRPVITGVLGAVADGQPITIAGEGFGAKVRAAPARWKTYEDGQVDSEGFSTSFAGSLEVATDGGRAGSTGYGRATFGTSEERISQQTTLDDGNPATVFTSFWLKIADEQQSGQFFVLNFGSGYFYLSTGCSDTLVRGGGECDGRVFDTEWGSGVGIPGETWVKTEVLATAAGVVVWVDGVRKLDRADWISGCPWAPSGQTLSLPSAIDEPGSRRCSAHPSYDGEYSCDDLYLDYTQARVELCLGSTWASRGGCETQLPSTWSTTSIDVTVNQGALAAGSTAYLYVVDPTGAANAAGHSIVLGN